MAERATRSLPGSSALAGAALGGVLAGAGLGWERLGHWRGPEVLIGLLVGLALVPPVVSVLRGRRDPFEPPVALSAIWMFAYVFPALAILSGTDPLWNEWGRRAQGSTRALLSGALGLSALFFAASLVGYYATAARRTARAHPSLPAIDDARFRFFAGCLTAVALVLFGVFVVQVGGLRLLLSSLNDRVRLFSGLNYLGLPVLSLLSVTLLAYSRSLLARRGVGAGLWIFALSAFGLNALQGSKTNLLAVALALVVTRHYLVGRIRLVVLGLASAAAVAGAVAFDLFFREYLVTGVLRTFDVRAPMVDAALAAWVAFATNAFVQVQVLMLMVDGIPGTLPFQLGKPYLALVLMPIPRAVFPDKPPVGTEVFSQAFFGDLLDQGTSIPTSLVGEFYMNFGAVGVALGGVLLGAVLARAYSWMLRNREQPATVPLYALTIATLLPWVRGDTFGPTVFYLAVALPLALLARVSRAPGRVSPEAAGRG